MAHPAPKVVASNKTRGQTRREELRDQLWPDAASLVWNRKKEKGFCTVPRTLALVMCLLDQLQKKKDASPVYLDLWCRAFDDYLIEVTDEPAFGYSAGYMTGRGVRTWRERVRLLEKWGFIRVKASGSRKIAYIFLVDPHKAVKLLHQKDQVPESWWNTFNHRAGEIGAVLP
jgi:hypothetical protein